MKFMPYVFDAFMKPFEKRALSDRRKRLIKKVSGKVLEIGAGTGANFFYYDEKKIENLTIVDLKFNSVIKNHKLNSNIDIDYIEGNAQNLPFEDMSFDSVVTTLIFCSVDNQHLALKEVYRVLKPGGKIYFIEHVLPEKKGYRKLVNTLNGPWHRISHCNINRETLKSIEESGFKVIDIESFGSSFFIAGIGEK